MDKIKEQKLCPMCGVNHCTRIKSGKCKGMWRGYCKACNTMASSIYRGRDSIKLKIERQNRILKELQEYCGWDKGRIETVKNEIRLLEKQLDLIERRPQELYMRNFDSNKSKVAFIEDGVMLDKELKDRGLTK